jgi:SAM-dependent methyltransferase
VSKLSINELKKLELDFWENDDFEGNGRETLESMVNKFSEFEIFFEKMKKYEYIFQASNLILEIGGGQLWASSILKKYFPEKRIIGTDISPHAIAGSYIWERVFNVELDRKLALDVVENETNLEQVDLIFCFASAHHFSDFDKTFEVLKKILSPNGKILFLHEPFANNLFYKFALKRVNKKRPVVHEDLLRPSLIRKASKANALIAMIYRLPSVINRRGIASIYYFVMQKIQFLNYVFPTSVDVLISQQDKKSNESITEKVTEFRGL